MQTPEQIPPEDQTNLSNETPSDAVNGLVDHDGVDLTEDFASGNSTVEYGEPSNERRDETVQRPINDAAPKQRFFVVPERTEIGTNPDRLTSLDPAQRLNKGSLPEPQTAGFRKAATLDALFEETQPTDNLPVQTEPASSWHELITPAETVTPAVQEGIVGSDAPTEVIDTAAIQEEMQRRESMRTGSSRDADTMPIPVINPDKDLNPLGDTQEFTAEDVATLQSWLMADDEQPTSSVTNEGQKLPAVHAAQELSASQQQEAEVAELKTWNRVLGRTAEGGAAAYGVGRLLDRLSDNPNAESLGRYVAVIGALAVGGAIVGKGRLMFERARHKSGRHGKHTAIAA
jgi:hypothetical protein